MGWAGEGQCGSRRTRPNQPTECRGCLAAPRSTGGGRGDETRREEEEEAALTQQPARERSPGPTTPTQPVAATGIEGRDRERGAKAGRGGGRSEQRTPSGGPTGDEKLLEWRPRHL